MGNQAIIVIAMGVQLILPELKEDSELNDQDSSINSPDRSRTKERRKIQIKFIENKTRRHVTFSKRKYGIMKKAFELSVLTGTQVLLLVVSETGLVYTFSTPKFEPIVTQQEGRNLIQACLNAPDVDGEEQETGYNEASQQLQISPQAQGQLQTPVQDVRNFQAPQLQDPQQHTQQMQEQAQQVQQIQQQLQQHQQLRQQFSHHLPTPDHPFTLDGFTSAKIPEPVGSQGGISVGQNPLQKLPDPNKINDLNQRQMSNQDRDGGPSYQGYYGDPRQHHF